MLISSFQKSVIARRLYFKTEIDYFFVHLIIFFRLLQIDAASLIYLNAKSYSDFNILEVKLKEL